MGIREFLGWMPDMTVTVDDTTGSAPQHVSAVKIEDAREDKPKFKRYYRTSLPDGRAMMVTAYSGYSGRYFSGEITQPGGRWVLFDPERVADKILDPQLVPVIMSLCREIFVLDDAFIASKPKEFVDESGARWVRA